MRKIKENNSGVYTITNLINGKIYVGSSVNLYNRKNIHYWSLKNNQHRNRHLQRAFNKYGIENFKFEILDYCDKEFCISTEQYWINMLNVTNINLGYNISPIANNNTGIKRSEETKKKIGDIHRGKPISKEHSQKLVEGMKKRNNNLSDEELKNWYLERRKLHKGFSKNVYQYDLNGNFIKKYETMKEAVINTGCNYSHISACCNNRKGRKYKYIFTFTQLFETSVR